MHIIISPAGSAGDVHPLVGIGTRLRARGHRVTVTSSDLFADAIQRAGLEFVSILSTDEFRLIQNDPDLWHPRRGLNAVARHSDAGNRRLYRYLEQAYQPGQTVLVGGTLAFATRLFQEKTGAPLATLHLQPTVLLSLEQTPKLPQAAWVQSAPRWVKRLFFWAADRFVVFPAFGPWLNRWRAELNLPPVRRRILWEWMHSPACTIGLFPTWYAPRARDWPPNTHLTGFPLFDESTGQPLPAEVQQFLVAGTPPVVLTFGSAMTQGARYFAAGIDALSRLQRRGLILTRYREQLPAELPAHLHYCPYLPFSEIFPHAAAIVHHGGVGTCAQGLAAGVPQVVMPLAHDQPDNADRLTRIGVARTLMPSRFTGPGLADTLRALWADPRTLPACRQWAERIRQENPVEETCGLIERLAEAR
jgi:rhamnosyltransferase subunit B